MIPNNVMQPQMQNLIPMWGGPAAIWNLGPGITPSYTGERVWTFNPNQNSIYIPEFENQLPPLGLMNLIGATSNGNKLASNAKFIAHFRNTYGKCYGAVADAVDSVSGKFLSGSSAYMAADQLKRSGKYTEHSVSASKLPSLPAGAIVVWRKTAASPHGHISVSLGNG